MKNALNILLKIILFCSIWNLHAYSDEVYIPSPKLHLKKSYKVYNEEIYSKDIFPQMDRNFKIATLPIDSFSLELKSVDLKLLFMRFGYEIEDFESEYVEFIYVPSGRDEPMDFIEKYYIKHYDKNLEIKNIRVRPLAKLPKNYTIQGFEIQPNNIKKNSGTFSMKYTTPQSKNIKKMSFLYEIDAKLSVLKSIQNIHSNENLSSANVAVDSIIFKRVGAEFASKEDMQKYSAKSYIRAQTPITKDKLKPRILIKKGDTIRVVSNESGVRIEILLVARQNGALKEIINAQNPQSGKILRVEVLDIGQGRLI